jgi:hypothetical protein
MNCEHLGRDELVAVLLGLLVGDIQEVIEIPGDLDLPAGALDLRQPVDRRLERALQLADVDPGLLQEQRGRPVVLGKQCREHVRRLDIGVVVPNGHALGIGQGLLKLRGELVGPHPHPSASRRFVYP